METRVHQNGAEEPLNSKRRQEQEDNRTQPDQ